MELNVLFSSRRKLQQPGANEEELSRVLRDSEFPLLKTNNKEVAGILQNLRKMEKRLEGMDDAEWKF